MSTEKALFSLEVLGTLVTNQYGKELADKLLVPIREELSAIKPQKTVHKPAVKPIPLEQADIKGLMTTGEVVEKTGLEKNFVLNWGFKHGDSFGLQLVGHTRMWTEEAVKKLVEDWENKGKYLVKGKQVNRESKFKPLTEEEADSMGLNEKQKKALEVVRNPELMKKSVEDLAWKVSQGLTPSQLSMREHN